MAHLQFKGLRKSYGDIQTLHGIDLTIEEGEFIVFVGPSGCGKSTLMRCIAGLEEITAGELHIGGALVNDLPPAKRGVAMVFQSYALYPHMTVADNMAFGLRLAGMSRLEQDDAVARAAKILQIEHLLQRKPKSLSGGQRQRVAIGRAIVRKPGVFLFDEPLSNLDATLRVQMRLELARLHRELSTTMIYVTHDQVEAMTLANRIVVFNSGRIEQVGAPMELYHGPSNLFVAGFIGSPRMNFIEATLDSNSANGAVLRLPDGRSILASVDSSGLKPGSPVTLGVRPEDFEIGAQTANELCGTVQMVEHLGDVTYLYLEVPGSKAPVTVRAKAGADAAMGQVAHLGLSRDRCHVFDPQGNALARTG